MRRVRAGGSDFFSCRMKKYDFIIAGGGMSGLSLAYYLTQSPLRNHSMLILDRDQKNRNDRTWSFWEDGTGPFESIMFRKWNTVSFHGTTHAGLLDMGSYQYKMLRGIDFYAFMDAELAKFPNIDRKQATINRIADSPQGGFVIANDEPYIADYVFDSTFALRLDQPQNHNLLQHFKGWVIEAEKPCFNPEQPEIMDFRVDQHGDCRFVYVMPFDAHTALIEFTLFNDKILTDAEYDTYIRQYISRFVDTGTYQIRETEFGVIPMSDVKTKENPSKHLVRIGTSGGYTKASTGYTFQRTQQYLRDIVHNLTETGRPIRQKSWFDGRFKLYDSVLLNVLEKKRHPANDVFTRFYAKNKPVDAFRFLDEKTRLTEEVRFFSTYPWRPFTVAFFDVMRRKLFG